MDEFWETCRCGPFEMLYEAVNRHIETFKWKYWRLAINEDIDLQSMTDRLKKQGLKSDFHIVGWRRYMNKAVYREVIRVNRHLIPKDARCGTCNHLPESKPHTCQKTGEDRKKTDGPCEKYARKIPIVKRIEGDYEDQVRDGEMSEVTEIVSGNTESPEAILEVKDLICKMKEALRKRVENAEPRSQIRSIHERQHEIFMNLLSLFSKGFSETEAIRLIAEECGVSDKTIQRDLMKIRKFLKKMSIEW